MMGTIVTNVYENSNYDQLHIDRASVIATTTRAIYTASRDLFLVQKT